MSVLHEVMVWTIYAMAAVVMLAAILSAVLAGLVLRFVAEFLREFGDGREGDARHAEDDPSTTTRANSA